MGWALLAYMSYMIATSKASLTKVWDPYDILGISTSADEKAIKKTYKLLSLKFHPDKVKPQGNETMEDLNNRYVEITKAYKALTDEEIRNNYIQYGHPDGKQSFSIGIALPKWIVAEGNTYYVLAVYGILFGILLPYTVGKWWYGSRRYTRDGVRTESAGRLFTAYTEETDEKQMVETLSLGEELKEIFDDESKWGAQDEAAVERKIGPFIGEKALKKVQSLEGWKRRALGLLWAFLYRIDLESEKLEKAKLQVAPIAVQLNKSFFAIALAYGNNTPILSSLHINQAIVQAVSPGDSPLLQLPHFTPKIVAAVEALESGKNHWTIQRFMEVPAERRKKVLVSSKLLTEEQYNQAITFAKNLPALTVEAAFFKVTGDKTVTPNSLVNFVVKARIVPPGEPVKPVDPKDLEDIDEAEDDVEALIGRKKNANQDKPVALAHAPYFPKDHVPEWQLFLGDAKQDKLIIPPTAYSTFEQQTESGVVTLKLQFQAPPQPGEYTFTMYLISDSYLGVDSKQSVTMHVLEPQAEADEDDEISEPDEGEFSRDSFTLKGKMLIYELDSIAGQMQTLRSGQAPKKKKKRAAGDESEEEDSDESGTDDEEEESETDTDTDTDGE